MRTLEEACYLPANEADDGYEAVTDSAVCVTCGFTDIGMMGCAPTPDDVAVDPDTLLHLSVTEDGLEVLSEEV